MEWGSMWERCTPEAEWITSPEPDPFREALGTHDAPRVQMLVHAEQLDRAEAVVADHLGWPVLGEHPPGTPPYTRQESIAGTRTSRGADTEPLGRAVPVEDVHEHVRSLPEWFGGDRLL